MTGVGPAVSDLLLPHTDAGVGAQLVVLAVLVGAGSWRTRRRPELRLLVWGIALVLLGMFGLRLLH